MFTHMNVLCAMICALGALSLHADAPGEEETSPENAPPIQWTAPAETPPPATEEPVVTPEKPPEETPAPTKKVKVTPAHFHPFTGKVKGKKVRLRLQPDIDSTIVKELHKGEYLAVVADAGDFFAVEPPLGTKAFVFRTFVLDGKVEGNRVNVRLQPDLDSPILAHLNTGDPVEGISPPEHNKWIEIPAPTTARFYVAKDYIENCGGPEVKAEIENRWTLATQQLQVAEELADSEMQKTYPSIDFDKISNNFQLVIQEYPEFAELTEKAKDALAKVQEQFLDRRIAYLENKSVTEEALATEKQQATLIPAAPTDKMMLWEPMEETLYQTWLRSNSSGNKDEYYEEQKLSAYSLSGILEPYLAPVKCKPADYILRNNDLPVAYVYSTMVNLQNLVGKQVTLLGSPRPNNNFAFPAYFIFSAE